MQLKIDKVIVYEIQFSETEKLKLCIELKKIDEEQYPTLVNLYKTISDLQVAFRAYDE